MNSEKINPFESNVNPYPESIVIRANKYKEYIQASETKETYHEYYLAHGEEIRRNTELLQKAENQKYIAERKRILKRLIKLNSLIGDVE